MTPQGVFLPVQGVLLTCAWLREAEHGHGQIREATAIALNCLQLALDLQQLQADRTRHKRRGGGNRGNDLAGDLLDGVAVSSGDAVAMT